MKRFVPLGLPELPIAAGATTPNPGTAALVWSTVAGAVIVWTGSAWALADTTGAGGGGGSPAGASGAVQFNNAGAFAGAALTTVNVDGQLNLLPGGFSSNPASGGILGMLSAAQYGVPAFEGMTGAPFALGQHLGLGRRFGLARANAGSALVPNLIGFPAATTTGSTLTTRLPTPSPVNAYAQRSARIGLVSAATAGSIAQYWFNPNPNFTAGNGNILGGFLACFRFVCSDAAVVSGARMFIGMQSGVAAPVNVEPNTLTVSIGLAQLSTSSNAHIVCGSALPAIDLGANFPLSGQSDSLYDLILYLPPSSPTTAYYEVRRYTTSVTAPFIATGTLNTGFPNTTQLGPRIWRTNNATALAVGLDLCHIYVEDASL